MPRVRRNDTVARALRESEELHRITLINMSDAVLITDDDGVFTYICPNVDVIFGHDQGAVQVMAHIARLLGRELVDRARLTADGEIRNIEHEIETKDGSRRSLLVHIKQVAIKGGTTLYVCRDITERKQSELALRRNEQRLTLALEAANMGLWDWDVPTGEMNWSTETRQMLGDSPHSPPPSLEALLDRVHPADRDRVSRTMAEAMEQGGSYETEFRVRGFDDGDRWVMGKGKALRNGKPLRMIGVFVDVTDRHRAEQHRQQLGGRLISAHEQERIRLSRELHDGVAQRVALLGAELGLLRQRLGAAPADLREQALRLSDQATDIGVELHRLSHELHPARLQQLGLEASLRSLGEEVAEAHGIRVDVDIPVPPRAVTPDIALNVYRVAQEALQNVVKHSRAAHVVVRLSQPDSDVILTVTDDGIGFDQHQTSGTSTMGLVSMCERAGLVGGQFTITSQPGRGTTVSLRARTGPG